MKTTGLSPCVCVYVCHVICVKMKCCHHKHMPEITNIDKWAMLHVPLSLEVLMSCCTHLLNLDLAFLENGLH